MRALSENLKVLYQRRIIIICIVIALFQVIQFFRPSGPAYEGNDLMIYGISIFLTGIFIGSLSASLWSKPLTFCLPGHSEPTRFLILMIGLIAVIIWGVVTVINFPRTIVATPALLVGLICFYSLACVLGIMLMIHFRLISYFMFFVPFLLLSISPITSVENLIETFLLPHPYLMMVTCGLASCFIFHPLGRKKDLRHLCNTPIRAMQKKSAGQPMSGVDLFFIKNIATSSSPFSQHIWGHLYLFFGPMIHQNKPFLFLSILTLFLIPTFFMGSQPPFNITYVCIISIVGASGWANRDRTNIWLPRGRSGKFFGGILSLSAFIISVLILLWGFVFLSKILSTTVPPVLLFGKTYNFISFEANSLYIPIVLIPFSVASCTLFKKKLLLGMIVPIALSPLFIFVHVQKLPQGGAILGGPNCLAVILAVVVSWSLYLAILCYDNMKRSLY